MSYRVSTQAYTGPFDLLLQLVSRQKVDIGAISISEVAEQYLARWSASRRLISTLRAISCSLQQPCLISKPRPRTHRDARTFWRCDDLDDEYAGLDADSLREVLIQRLIAYKQFKGAAAPWEPAWRPKAACTRA